MHGQQNIKFLERMSSTCVCVCVCVHTYSELVCVSACLPSQRTAGSCTWCRQL